MNLYNPIYELLEFFESKTTLWAKLMTLLIIVFQYASFWVQL